jgi:hypothetical protein
MSDNQKPAVRAIAPQLIELRESLRWQRGVFLGVVERAMGENNSTWRFGSQWQRCQKGRSVLRQLCAGPGQALARKRDAAGVRQTT